MRRLISCGFLLFVSVIMVVPFAEVHALPPLPSSFYGTVTLNEEVLPENTIIQALIDGQVYASTASQLYQGNSVYSLVVPGDDPATDSVEGGVAGDTIQFKVGGNLASQTAEWQSGVNENLDLTASGVVVIATATPKPTRTPTPRPTNTKKSTTPRSTPSPTTRLTNTKTSSAPLSTSTLNPTATIRVFVTLTQTITQTGLSTEEQASSTPSTLVETEVVDAETQALVDVEETPTTEVSGFQDEKAVSENTLKAEASVVVEENDDKDETGVTWLYFLLPTGILIVIGFITFAIQKKQRSEHDLL